jgi:hypothetical protein
MKKKIHLLSIFLIPLFFISIVAVSMPFAKSQQQAPLPDSQQPPPPQPPTKPKSEFWDLELERITVKGKSYSPGQKDDVQVKVGENVTIRCYYTMKTISIGDITQSDAQYWGSGNFAFKIATGIGLTFGLVKIDTKKLPKFAYEDVQDWKNYMNSNAHKTWTGYTVFQWTPKAEHVGKQGLLVLCNADNKNDIKEPDENNNSVFDIGPYVSFIVKHKIIAPGTFKDKIEGNKSRKQER